MTKVSIVIINYNNAQYLRTSVPAALANNVHEVIVVDDCSDDESLAILAEYPVRVVRNDTNLGPVAARNRGAAVATGDYILFLDSDAKLEPGYAATLGAYLDSHARVGVVSGRTMQDGARIWYNMGRDPGPINSVLSRLFKWHNLNYAPDVERTVDWVVEMAFMTRRALFEQVGGLDERYFMYFEGPDYCRTVRGKGYTAVFTPTVSVEHLGGHSHPTKRAGFHRDSLRLYYQKWGWF